MAKAKSLKTRARPASRPRPAMTTSPDALVETTVDSIPAPAGRVAAVMSLPPPTGIPAQPKRKSPFFAPVGASHYQNAKTLGEFDATALES